MSEFDDLDAKAGEWGIAPLLAALAESDAVAPPAATRDLLLQRAAASPPTLAMPATPVELYIGRVRALRELLATLTADDWTKRAAPYDWTVHGLVAHLLVSDRYTAAVLGSGDMPSGPTSKHLELGADTIAAELTSPTADTVLRWSTAAQTVSDIISAPGFDLDAPMPLHGWPFSAAAGLVARAFELWTHTEDIERATGRRERETPATELRAMSSFSVNSLPLALPLVAPEQSMLPTRVVLTGAGGGTFDIGGDGTRVALVVADVVDYCRMVARRIDPADLDSTLEGDTHLAHALLNAGRVFAV
jgi:uncharacterized protein (TIGR03083 family)